MDSIIDIDEPPIFCREEWIGKKNIYSRQNLPLFMINACDTAFAIPPNEMARFPDCNIAVSDLLRKVLPPLSYSGIVTRVFTWFFIIIYITILLITGSNIIKLDRRNNEGRKNK